MTESISNSNEREVLKMTAEFLEFTTAFYWAKVYMLLTRNFIGMEVVSRGPGTIVSVKVQGYLVKVSFTNSCYVELRNVLRHSAVE